MSRRYPFYMTQKEVRAMLAEKIALCPSEAAMARMIGVSRSYFNRVVRGEKPPQGKVLRFLGLKESVVYVASVDRTGAAE